MGRQTNKKPKVPSHIHVPPVLPQKKAKESGFYFQPGKTISKANFDSYFVRRQMEKTWTTADGKKVDYQVKKLGYK
ncbi:hypothetical protein Peur_008131 [Populus x canadensis]